MQRKGLTRLIFLVVFLIPVVWYLILQLFGRNNYALGLMDEIDPACGQQTEVSILIWRDSVSLAKQNYQDRVSFGANKRKVVLKKVEKSFFECINQPDVDMILVNEEGLWGTYELSREGVDQLLTELDILLLQQSYGKGTHR